jgi:RNA polymerase sigma factor (sigma-70 family)
MTSAQAGIVLHHLRRPAGSSRAAPHPDAQLLGRFTARRDEAAFAALVRRHGPMVLNVCRSVLRHEQDAEDAFQATFLVLARKAASIRRPGAVAGWLCEVAYHAAVKAQSDAARRRAQERRAPPMAPADPTLDMTLRDLRRVLHEELRRLPEKYRLPLVLCYLEGRSYEEAAGQLGWGRGTFRGRLDRGREHLRRRLAARGVALSALVCAAAVAPRAAAEALVNSVARKASGATSARASALAEGVIRAMFPSKLKIVTAVLLAAGLVAGAAALTQRLTANDDAAKPPVAPATPEVKLPALHDNDSIAYSGRVLGPDGRPVPGARLYLTLSRGNPERPPPSPEYGTTGPDGRFAFTAPKAPFRGQPTTVTATAADHGPGWVDVSAGDTGADLTIRLVADDVPVTGQIIDLEARPVPGATVRVLQIKAAPGEDLGPWLEAARGKKGRSFDLERQYLRRSTSALSPVVTTDAEGRFRLTGIGRDRLVTVRLDGPGLVSQYLHILTRPEPTVEVTEREGRPRPGEPPTVTRYYGADFRHVAAPTKPVVGVIRDKDTKEPLAGVTVRPLKLANNPLHYLDGQEIVRATTDAEGRYRLTGLPKGVGNRVKVIPNNLPYVPVVADVPDSPGLDPVTVDFDLKRGVWIEGKITDKVTGKPVGGGVEYFALGGNPNLADYPGFGDAPFNSVEVKEDGLYRVAGLPGPGLVAVYTPRNHDLRAVQRQDEYGMQGLDPRSSPYRQLQGSNCGAVVRIDPARGADAVKRDVTLDPGWKFTGTVLGPDGKPLAGARNFDLAARGWDREATATAEFTVWSNPLWPRDILFQQLERGLVGVAHTPKENGGAVTVRMGPGAAVTGRLVDADGQPRAGVELTVTFRPKGDRHWTDYPPYRITTDKEGRFRVAALLPGYEFRLSAGPGEVPVGGALRPGQTTDLGDVRMKRADD